MPDSGLWRVNNQRQLELIVNLVGDEMLLSMWDWVPCGVQGCGSMKLLSWLSSQIELAVASPPQINRSRAHYHSRSNERGYGLDLGFLVFPDSETFAGIVFEW